MKKEILAKKKFISENRCNDYKKYIEYYEILYDYYKGKKNEENVKNKLKDILDDYGKEVLYRKVGYILSFYKEEFDISDSFFDFCLKKGVNSNRGCLINNSKEELTYNSFWGLYVYPNIRNLYNKGEMLDV